MYCLYALAKNKDLILTTRDCKCLAVVAFVYARVAAIILIVEMFMQYMNVPVLASYISFCKALMQQQHACFT